MDPWLKRMGSMAPLLSRCRDLNANLGEGVTFHVVEGGVVDPRLKRVGVHGPPSFKVSRLKCELG